MDEGDDVTAAERQRLQRVVLVEMVTAFVLVMVVLVALFASGRLDGPWRGTVVYETPALCERVAR